MNAKKLLAGALCATMVLGTNAVVFAADSNTDPASNSGSPVNGSSVIEGVTPDEVFTVALPTTTAATYKFTLDPDKLLYQTSAASGYADANVFFANTGSTYSATSDGAVAVNKSMMDVILTVDVSVTNVDTNPVVFSDTASFTSSDTDLGLYMAIIPAAKGTVADTATATVGAATAAQAVAIDESGEATMSFYIPGIAANYELKQGVAAADGTHAYSYAKITSPSDWNTAGFYLNAVCNSYADWTDYNTKAKDTVGGAENLSVSVVWTMTAATEAEIAKAATVEGKADTTTSVFVSEAAPDVVTKTYTVNPGDTVTVNASLGVGSLAATGITKVCAVANGTEINLSTYITITGSTITIKDSLTTAWSGNSYPIKVYFNDSANTVVTLTLTVS